MEANNNISIISNRRSKSTTERTAAIILRICAVVSILAVASITIYMIISGTPALFSQGIVDILFNPVWDPTGSEAQYGILLIILTSIVGVAAAIVVGVPIGLLTAVFLSEIAQPRQRGIVRSAVELLAGIPSVIYGLLGILIINPFMYDLEKIIFANDPNHQVTGGANLLSAILVLAIMILPTLINISQTALESVPDNYRQSSLALGASKIQTIFKVVIPAAKNGILSAVVLGVGRAIGEAMAIVLVSGNSVNFPTPFASVRFLTTGIVTDFAYATGVHLDVLYTIALVLFVFIMVINIILTRLVRASVASDN